MDWLRSEDLKEEEGGNHLASYYSNCREIAWSLSPCEECGMRFLGAQATDFG
jgi:hypothetical protein